MAADAMRLAKRLDEVGFSDIVQVRNKVMELRAAGQSVHAFHGGRRPGADGGASDGARPAAATDVQAGLADGAGYVRQDGAAGSDGRRHRTAGPRAGRRS